MGKNEFKKQGSLFGDDIDDMPDDGEGGYFVADSAVTFTQFVLDIGDLYANAPLKSEGHNFTRDNRLWAVWLRIRSVLTPEFREIVKAELKIVES